MTGGNATFGTTTHEAFVMAVMNQPAGGINGKKVRLISQDDRSSPRKPHQSSKS